MKGTLCQLKNHEPKSQKGFFCGRSRETVATRELFSSLGAILKSRPHWKGGGTCDTHEADEITDKLCGCDCDRGKGKISGKFDNVIQVRPLKALLPKNGNQAIPDRSKRISLSLPFAVACPLWVPFVTSKGSKDQ